MGRLPEHAGAPYVMQGIELATGLVIGVDRSRAPLRPRPVALAELSGVLEQALVPALQRAPCVVAFSGGRDSAGLLAAATRAARRHGLPLPIPASYRFPGIEDVDESAWQDSVVRHLDLEDWVRVEVTDELDLVGPVAGPVLRRFGPLWPPNSHFGGLLVPYARGGTLVTGVGGDQLLEPDAHPVARLLTRRRRPRRSDLRSVAAAMAPRAVRVWRARRHVEPLPWLTPGAAAAHGRALAQETLEPLWWGRSVTEDWWRSRGRLAMRASIAAACGDDVTVEHPFMDPAFLGAVGGGAVARRVPEPRRGHGSAVRRGAPPGGPAAVKQGRILWRVRKPTQPGVHPLVGRHGGRSDAGGRAGLAGVLGRAPGRCALVRAAAIGVVGRRKRCKN